MSAVLLAALAAWPAQAATATIKVKDSYFTPDFRVIVTGDTVSWTFEGAAGHTVTSYPGAHTSFDSSPNTTDSCDPTGGGIIGGPPVTPDCRFAGDPSFDVTFTTVGTLDYYCKIHGDPSIHPDPSLSDAAQPCGMCGRIKVKLPSSADPATRHPTPGPDASGSGEPSATASVTASGEPTPSTNPTLVAGPSSDDGGSGALRALFATVAIGLLTGLGVLVWRRYFAPAE